MAAIIFEGTDRVGKGTQISLLRNRLAKKKETVHVLHYSGFKLPKEECIEYSRIIYEEMFSYFLRLPTHLICDRAHLGEYVYGKIYRDYEADWIFTHEDYYQKCMDNVKVPLFLIVLIDKPENLLTRDDGQSFTNELEKKTYEVERFKEAFQKSKIRNKLLIDIDGKDIAAVEAEIKNFLGV